MNLTITARNFELTDALKDFAEKKAAKLERFDHYLIDGHLILEKDKSMSVIELTMVVKHANINSQVKNPDIYLGISEVVKKVERQLEKYEARFRERKRTAMKTKRI
jgi:putative sigma-54 modulation protein